MSTYSATFENDAIGTDPVGFTDSESVWSVQNDSGKVVKNSGDGNLTWNLPLTNYDNFILRFRVKFVSGTFNRWQVQIRRDGSNKNRVSVGCIYSNDRIDIYEKVNNVIYERTGVDFTYGTSFHDVEIVCQDASVVVRIDDTEVHYDTLSVLSGPLIVFNANSGSINEFDDLVLIVNDFTLNRIKDDAFNNSSIGSNWTIAYGGITGVLFSESSSELTYSGTPSVGGYVAIHTRYVSKRCGWYHEIQFRLPTLGFGVGSEILFRVESDNINFVEISCQADGYRVEKVENGLQPSGSVSDPVALFGNESTVFHTLKLLWDEELHYVWGWVDNSFIARLDADVSTFPDHFRFIVHLNNTISTPIDRRFKNFEAKNATNLVIKGLTPTFRPDIMYNEQT